MICAIYICIAPCCAFQFNQHATAEVSEFGGRRSTTISTAPLIFTWYQSLGDSSFKISMASSSLTSNPLLGVQVTEKLTHQNHAMWSAQVLATLRGARLESYVNGKAVAPAAEVEEKKADGKTIMASNPAYEEWFAADQQVLGFLLSSLSRDILAQVAISRTSTEA